MVRCKSSGDECGVADLLDGNGVERELRAAREQCGELAREAEADVEGGDAKGRRMKIRHGVKYNVYMSCVTVSRVVA
jgi:hypothetical protein